MEATVDNEKLKIHEAIQLMAHRSDEELTNALEQAARLLRHRRINTRGYDASLSDNARENIVEYVEHINSQIKALLNIW